MAGVRLIQSTTGIFNRENFASSYVYMMPGYTVENGGYYNKFIQINTDKNVVEVPVFLRTVLEEHLEKIGAHKRSISDRIGAELVYPTEFLFPMFNNSNMSGQGIPEKKTGDAILALLNTVSVDQRYIEFKVPGSTKIFKGTKGLILDNNDKVLLLCTSLLTNNMESSRYRDYEVTSHNIYVSPSAFVEKDLVSKAIITRFLPMLIDKNVTRKPYKILIEDVDLIKKPILPTDFSNISNEINALALSNLDNIMTGYISTDYNIF